MAQYDPTWSYGESKLFNSSGATVTDGDDIWNYGKDQLFHEFTAAVVGAVMNQMQKNNLGADLFNGTLI